MVACAFQFVQFDLSFKARSRICFDKGYLCRVKQVIVIGAFLLNLFGHFVTEAKAPVQPHTKNQQEISNPAAFSFYRDHPADLTQPARIHCITFKGRDLRPFSGLGSTEAGTQLLPCQFSTPPSLCTSPASITLIRLILFPNHYFW